METHVQLAREAGKALLAVHAGQDMKCELLGPLDNDVVAVSVPANHVLVLRLLEETARNEA